MQDLKKLLDIPFTFVLRHSHIPSDLRPVWRLTTLAISVRHCRGDRASLEQLHVLNWALRSEETRAAFLRFLGGSRKPDEAIVRLDPSLSRAVAFAIHEGLLQKTLTSVTERQNYAATPPYRLALTQKGKSLADQAMAYPDCFVPERRFFQEATYIAKGKLTQSQVRGLFGR